MCIFTHLILLNLKQLFLSENETTLESKRKKGEKSLSSLAKD